MNDDHALPALIHDLVHAFQVLAMDGQGSGISGHLTARLPNARTFWSIPYGFGFEEATAEQLIESDFELRTVTGSLPCNPTLNIHTEIYEARPEVCCILHTHSEASLALGIVGSNLEPVTQSGALFYEDIVLFDEFDGIVLDKKEGASIAARLGTNRAILLRNHGSVVVGESIADTAIAATVLEFAARVQLQAMAVGTPKKLPPAEARQTKAFLRRPDVVDLRWQLLVRQARRHNPHFTFERNFA
ncbi:class II aldolase/adducin family protein [Variovorax sp. J22G73]|uniref:class II aldolase/adducin family protein n=1 Tax=unclassified Variovorax TaxID=663243 RepID=UPI002574B8EF|nr:MULTISPECIES: class II aldolase/adducin family protein [unclassified Variovorax]MDM0005404.1 class II aldolase/adducin family protein [Variovorax sp. J22R203]MDM0098820.1 class II aldolase/adducin family protein [Variovorax sp. J22G73]